jgi:pantoate kinase
MASARAFCPGHITAFFEIVDAEEPVKKGSRGAGFCISEGVITEVMVKSSNEQSLEIRIDGEITEAETTELVARMLMGSKKVEVRINSEAGLPVSQGFGMSGAGALSTALALNRAMGLRLETDELVRLAHSAEVEAMTGLGDVYPQSLGGMDTRLIAGAPPYGEVKRTESSRSIVLVVLGEELKTKDILRNPQSRKKISEVGKNCVDEYQKDHSWSKLCFLSQSFARETGLMSQEVESAIKAVESVGGTAGMAMLGNSIFASGKVDKSRGALRNKGEVFHCTIDNKGARLIPQA